MPTTAPSQPAPSRPPHVPQPTVRLLPPQASTTAPLALDESQSAALRAARDAQALLVVGAAGTGKTTLVEHVATAAINEWGIAPDRVVVLAATRRAAGELRDRVGHATGATATTPRVRTAASLAVAILNARAAALGSEVPSFVTGPEQDRDLAEIVAGWLAEFSDPANPQRVELLPPGWTPEIMSLRGFRDQLRDLLMRAAECGLEPAALARLGAEYSRPEWVFAAEVYQEYRAINKLRSLTPGGGSRLDPGVVVAEATKALANWDAQITAANPPRFDLVIVDDYQEATFATAGLLSVLHAAGARLVLVGDPDSSVQSFRGASPMLVGRAQKPAGSELGAFGAQARVLPTNWRQPPLLQDVVARVTSQIPTVGGPIHRSVPRFGDNDAAAVPLAREFDSAAAECAWIARELRAAHLLRGVPWDRMAVIARSGRKLAEIRRELSAAGVPVSVPGAQLPLRNEPAVAPLLALYTFALEPEELTSQAVAELLTSPIGGLDSLSLRRLRRRLRALDESRTSDEMLLDAIHGPDPTLAVALREDDPIHALAALSAILTAGAKAAADDGASAETVLWAIWSATGLAERWRATAIAGGTAGLRADHDLDTVVALFQAAEVFVERNPGAPLGAFLESLSAQDVPADSLAAAGRGVATVAAVTPAMAAGREWDLVVVAGVQDGVWPNLRLRDSLFGAFALTELLAGRTDRGRIDDQAARREVLADELRAFAVAISRARKTLVITAVSAGEDFPSAFFELVANRANQGVVKVGRSGAGRSDSLSNELDFSTVGFDLSGVVTVARRILLDGLREQAADSSLDSIGKTSRDRVIGAAVRLLAELAARGVAAADPRNWYGSADPSSDSQLWPQEQLVPVSASALELIGKCPLRWAFETAGAKAAIAYQQQLGTLIHSIAERRPDGTRSQYLDDLDQRWSELDLPDNWLARRLRQDAEAAMGRLAEFVAQNPGQLAVEQKFTAEIGRAELRGKVDRVDAVRGPDGTIGALVTDFKTSSHAISVAEQNTNPQLAAYQLAISESVGLQAVLAEKAGSPVASAGARLVYLSLGTTDPTTRTQGALTDKPMADPTGTSSNQWARDLVDSAARSIAGNQFIAQENDWCRHCPVATSCPLRERN